MSSSPSSTTERVIPETKYRQSPAEFVRWSLAQLDLDFWEEQSVVRLPLPENDQAAFSGQTELKLALDAGAPDDACEPTDLNGRFTNWLLSRLHDVGLAVPIRPLNQPTAVNDITQNLFAAYQVDGGHVHLGGCQLTDYPFLRLSFIVQQDGQEEIRHIFVAHDGSSVTDQTVRDLGLLDIEPVLDRPPRIDDAAMRSLITAGRRVAAQTTTSRDPNAVTVEPAVTAVVWVKHASGTLKFTIGESTVSLPFSGWAKIAQAQPYTSPKSGASGFHLAATDDGQIDIVDQIATCEQSGKRVLRQELVTCAVTGKRVLEEFTETCPVSGKPALSAEFSTCPHCKQLVSNLVLQSGACSACRQLSKIKKDDPRLVWILGEHTGLDRWNRWQLSETKTVYIAHASSWTKRLLIVVDKESLAIHHLATAGLLASDWAPVSESTRSELLQ